jgi:hypothetical protein
MWRVLLGPDGSSLYPLPWYTWALDVSGPIAVAEVASARNWVDLVCAYPRHAGGFVYPDWVKISRTFAAVHITLPAIAAAQGFALMTPKGTIPPGFWDVETTFWTRWSFARTRLVEMIGGHERSRGEL